MVQITQPSGIDAPAEGIEAGVTRARGIFESISERAGTALAGLDIVAAELIADARDALAHTIATEDVTPRDLEAARDRERLRSAVIAGVAIFITTAVVLLIARQIAARRAETERRRLRAAAAANEGGPAVV